MSVQRVLVIDQTVAEYQAIAAAARTDVRVVVFDPKEDTYSSLLQKIGEGSFQSVGFVQHGSYTAPEYRLLEKETSAKVLGVESEDAQLATWEGFRGFINLLKGANGISVVDLISCELYSNPSWIYILGELEKQIGIDFRASSDPTGNLANGGNWVQESDNVNIEDLYFTEAIQGYTGLLFTHTNTANAGTNRIVKDRYGNLVYLSADINGRALNPQIKSTKEELYWPSGPILAWGQSGYGNNPPASVTNTADANYVDVVYLESTNEAFAALRTDGTVIAWGTSGGSAPISVTDKNNVNFVPVKKLCSSQGAFAALRTNGSVVAWGNSGNGGSTTSVASSLTSGVVELYSNMNSFVALKSNGTAIAWGTLASGTAPSSVTNISDPNFLPVVAIYFTRENSFVALRNNGSIVAWGDSASGGSVTSPVNVSSLVTSDIDIVFSTNSAFAALKSNGSVVAWGNTTNGGSAPASVTDVNNPAFVRVTKIYSTTNAFAALREDGTIVAWGASGDGGSAPVDVTDKNNVNFVRVAQVYPNDLAFIALRTNGTVRGWGQYNSGGTGNVPASVTNTGANVVAVYSSWSSFAALKSDGSVVSWGGAFGASAAPTSVTAANSGVTSIVSAGYGYIAIKNNGSAIPWGHMSDASAFASQLTSGVIAAFTTAIGYAVLKPRTPVNITDYYYSTGALIMPVAPGAPTLSSVVRGNGTLTVNFSAPASNGGDALTKYTITYGGSTVDVTNTALTSYEITGLTNGTSYAVSIKAVNRVGPSIASNQISGTPATTPSAPTITSITVGDTELTINYSAPFNGGDAITKYILSYGANSIDITNLSATSYLVTGLTNGTTYTFTMKAVNSIGESVSSSSQNGTPVTSQRAPVLSGSHSFSTINASSAGGSVFSISSIAAALTIEDVNSETPQQSIGFAVTSADNTLGTWYYSVNNQVTWVAMSSVSSSNAVHLGRTGNEFLKFVPTSAESVGSTSIVVRAWDATNSGQLVANVGDASSVGGITAYSSDAVTISATIITGPSAPRNFSAAVSTTTLNFSWLAPSRIGALSITNYQIVNMDTDAVVLETNTLSGSLSNLTPYTIYRYAIRAINNEGIVSELSSTITAMPLQATNTVNTSSITQSISTLLQSGGSGGTAAVASVLESTSQNTEAVRNILESVINTQTSISTISVAEATTVFSSITTLVSNITNTSTQKLVVQQASRAIFEGTLAQVAVTASSSTETVTAVKDAFLTTFSTLKTTGGVSSFATEGLKAAAQALLSDPGIPEETALTAALFTSYSDTTSKAAIFDALIQEKPAQSFTLSSELTTQLIANIPSENRTLEFNSLTSLDLLVPSQTNLVNLTDTDLTGGNAALIAFKPDVTYKVTYNGANVLIKYISSENKMYRNNVAVPLGENIRVGDSFFKLLQVGTGTWTNNTPGWNYNNPDAIPCIVKGQRILTPDGEVPVETLKDGDLIRTPDGRDVPVKVYPFTVEKATAKTAPIYIPKDVFGTNYPPREIVLSGHHAIMKSKDLWELPMYAVNRHRGVIQKGLGQKIEYFHVETPNYFTDLLVVEGSVIEGYGANFMKAIGMSHEKIYRYNKQQKGYHRVIPSNYAKRNVNGKGV